MTQYDHVRDENALAGKLRRLQRLSDGRHRFAMLAIDQRGSLRKMIAARTGVAVDAVPDKALSIVKEVITTALAPVATAVLTDPLHGYPNSPSVVPPRVGLLLALEVSGYEASGDHERLTRVIDGWSPAAIGRSGADAVKLLLWHRADVSHDVLRHQESMVVQIGAECAEAGLPFVLEVLTYPTHGQDAASAEYATLKPDLVIEAASRFSEPRFGVDLLKLEFPGNLKYVAEYQDRPFGAGTVVADRSHVEAHCRQLDAAARVPWVILSAGVDPEEFVENVRLANAAGASGFLCGRAVWKKVLDLYPDVQSMRQFAGSTAREYFTRIRDANDAATPWSQRANSVYAEPVAS